MIRPTKWLALLLLSLLWAAEVLNPRLSCVSWAVKEGLIVTMSAVWMPSRTEMLSSPHLPLSCPSIFSLFILISRLCFLHSLFFFLWPSCSQTPAETESSNDGPGTLKDWRGLRCEHTHMLLCVCVCVFPGSTTSLLVSVPGRERRQEQLQIQSQERGQQRMAPRPTARMRDSGA